MNSVILVPVGGSVVPECDSALQALERRGYEVRRIRGFSQIDVGRNQIATDALADGFEELIWIDSDVVFDPDDIERLRDHHVPFVCGIYPKKGLREFACNYLPGTKKVVFGQEGGLHEFLYVGFGFNYTHRSVYEQVQSQLRLPICNEQFGSPMVPYFMPMVANSESGPWYLGEDYAFCERARQCGIKIHVDTRIRLWHVGNYKYSWEDAGTQLERFGNFTFNTGMNWDRMRAPPSDPARSAQFLATSGPLDAWERFRQSIPWPKVRPDAIPNRRHGWLSPSSQALLSDQVTARTQLVVELGGWLGLSTRFILDRQPSVKLITVDRWDGSEEHRASPETARLLPRLFDTFLTNCWEYQNRLLPLRMSTLDGLRRIAEAGLKPDVIYIDADHRFEAVRADLELCLKLFPQSSIIGDDWEWESVRKAVESVAQERGLQIEPWGAAWRLKK